MDGRNAAAPGPGGAVVFHAFHPERIPAEAAGIDDLRIRVRFGEFSCTVVMHEHFLSFTILISSAVLALALPLK
jgi:hypothetical protein